MKKIFLKFIAPVLFTLAFVACDKEDEEEATGTVKLEMEYVWGMNQEQFALNQQLVHPMTKDTLTFNTFKHYISGVKLVKTDGSKVAEEESYHLIDLSDASSLEIDLSDIPAGDYSGIEITFGVDSTRNVSGAQTGALDVSNGMFWSWNTGYIMLKAEGESPQIDGGTFAYHLGGFSGENNIINSRTFTFSETLLVAEDNESHVHITANPAKLFHTHGSVESGSVHMPGEKAKIMADDFNNAVMVSLH